MKVYKSVKLDLDRDEAEAIQIVFHMLNQIDMDEKGAIDSCLSIGCSIEDVRVALMDLWELSGHDMDQL